MRWSMFIGHSWPGQGEQGEWFRFALSQWLTLLSTSRRDRDDNTGKLWLKELCYSVNGGPSSLVRPRVVGLLATLSTATVVGGSSGLPSLRRSAFSLTSFASPALRLRFPRHLRTSSPTGRSPRRFAPTCSRTSVRSLFAGRARSLGKSVVQELFGWGGEYPTR